MWELTITNVLYTSIFCYSPEDIERFKKQMSLKSAEKSNQLDDNSSGDKIKEIKSELANGVLPNGESNNNEMSIALD